MIRTLVWKEYREQRGIWLLLAATGLLFGFGVPYLLREDQNRLVLPSAAVIFIMIEYIYGLICGSMMLAGEREAGTIVFLDILPGDRWRVWKTKAIVGMVLCLSHAAIMAAGMLIAYRLGYILEGPQRLTQTMAVLLTAALSVSGFCWSLFSSSLFKRVAVAALVALWLFALAIGWTTILLEASHGFGGGYQSFEVNIFVSFPLTIIALFASAFVFCGWRDVPLTHDWSWRGARVWILMAIIDVCLFVTLSGFVIRPFSGIGVEHLYLLCMVLVYFGFTLLCGWMLSQWHRPLTPDPSPLSTGERGAFGPLFRMAIVQALLFHLIVYFPLHALHYYPSQIAEDWRMYVLLGTSVIFCFMANILGYHARRLRERWQVAALVAGAVSVVLLIVNVAVYKEVFPPWASDGSLTVEGFLSYYAVGSLFITLITACWLLAQPRLERVAWAIAPYRPQFAGTGATLWLCFRQGRWLILVMAIITPLLAAWLVWVRSPIVWPLGTFIIGVVCGLACLLDENSGDSSRFLADRRFPLWRVWLTKTCFWMAVAGGLSGVFVMVEITMLTVGRPQNDRGIEYIGRVLPFDTLIFASSDSFKAITSFFLVYGFAFAQFFTLLSRKILVSTFVTVAIAGVAVALWLPSLLMGGVSVWQLYGLPLLILVLSRLALWAWASDRLRGWKALGYATTFACVTAAWFAAVLWWRAHEIPYDGEPFDVAAFEATIPSVEANKSGRLVAQGISELEKVILTETIATEEERRYQQTVETQFRGVLKNGWGRDDTEELASELNHVFQTGWYDKLKEAAELPMGVLFRSEGTLSSETRARGSQFAEYIAARMLQLQSEGKDEESLGYFRVLLATSRISMNYAPLSFYGMGWLPENVAMRTLPLWLEKNGPNESTLTRCLKELNHHMAERPSYVGNLEADYLDDHNRLSPKAAFTFGLQDATRDLEVLPLLVPWERERLYRIRAFFYSKRIAAEGLSYADFRKSSRPRNRIEWELNRDSVVLPPWEDILKYGFAARTIYTRLLQSNFFEGTYATRCRLEGARLQVALALFQVKNGRPAASLNELVPDYLPAVPIDPYSGQAFRYRVSAGEAIENDRYTIADADGVRNKMDIVAPGQGIVWSVGADGIDDGGMWEYRSDGTGDVIFIVPVWPKKGD